MNPLQRTVWFLASLDGLLRRWHRPYTVRLVFPRLHAVGRSTLHPVDSIEPVSGKLHMEIPLASLPRGGRFGIRLSLVYDSHLTIWTRENGQS